MGGGDSLEASIYGRMECSSASNSVKYHENGEQTTQLGNVVAKSDKRHFGGVVGTKACLE